MTAKTKLWLITATLLVLIGLIIFVGVMTVLKWDFSKLSTVKYETNEYAINENFRDISVTVKTARITFAPTDKATPYVVCHEQKNVKHEVSVSNGTLTVKVTDTRKWYEHIGINFGASKITVFLPSVSYGVCTVKSSTGDIEIPKAFVFEGIDVSSSTGDVDCYASATGSIKINVSTGDIKAESISADSVSLTVSTGKINIKNASSSEELKTKVSTGKLTLTDVTCKSLVSDGDTGDVYLTNVIAADKFDVKRSTGDINFDGCDAGEIFITTDTGDIRGTLITEKVFIANSKTGKADVPKTVSGGRCEITTDTGDIKITLVSP